MSQAREPDEGAVQTAQPAPHGVEAAAVSPHGPVLLDGRPVAPVSQEKADSVFAFTEAVAVFLVDMTNSDDLGRLDRERAERLIDQMRQL